MSRLSFIATIGLLAAQSAYGAVTRRFDSLEPFYDHDANVPADCSLWWNSDDGLGCDTVLIIADISVAELVRLNPSMSSCSDWESDRSYCVKNAAGPPASTAPASITPVPTAIPTTAAAAVTTTTITAGNGVATPEPVQPGIVGNCKSFYLVQAGDTCAKIAASSGVTVDQLATWNTNIGGTSCTGIWAGYYLCTGIIGSTTTQPPTTNPTPQPIQAGMVNNCNSWHLVQAGDTCATIAGSVGITVAQIATWNTGIGGTACTGMWAGYYLCTGIEGTATTPPPANTTPSPIQNGMVSNCKTFHFVESGQNCEIIAGRYGITVANFIRWNPAAGTACTGLWANTYACVGL
ncbi:hypothetical protein EsH8_XII_000056 [Colletotrichum jinshuiense]